ncbi:MAG: WhiB family transcriptional regulator, redox-sensing transcriptional regulator [Mycobacterium sp.]|nr:WhiB family transcriptional regulator, redox-sensing transcriptional regulator [Mycobacterium sp.]
MSGSKPAGQKPHRASLQEAVSSTDPEEPWASRALCRDGDADELFVRGAAQRTAAVICRHCPVMLECGAEALDNRVDFGVWGGMTERQRRTLLRQHPEVVSWSNFLSKRGNSHVARNAMIAFNLTKIMAASLVSGAIVKYCSWDEGK